jgi:hypothetical protein
MIDLMFVKSIERDLQPFLFSELGLNSTDSNKACAIYLAENPSVTATRADLVARRARLVNVQQALRDFPLASSYLV